MSSWAACPDWWQKLQRGETPMPDLDLDENLAEVAVELFDKLVVPDIPGQPPMADKAGEWVRDIVRAAFGSIDPATGARQVGEIFNLVPKKNAKTTNAAGLGLVALQMNTTPNIKGIIVGPTQSVADTCFGQMQGMIAADEWLAKRFKVNEHKKEITDIFPDPETGRPMNAKLKVMSFDPAVTTGGIPAFAILDELHVMAEKHYASRVIGQIRGGMITNPESLLVIITTQSEIPPQGVFKAELEYARRVRDGAVTEGVRMLPVMYEFPAEVQTDKKKPWRDPKTWPAVLPNVGRSITVERLVTEFQKAVDTGDEELARWASQHLNIQIGMGHHLGGWAGAYFWLQNARPGGMTLEEMLDLCEVAVIGGDVGGADDLFGLAVLGRRKGGKGLLCWARAWATEIVLERRKSIAEKLRDLSKQGDLIITETATEQVEQAAEICEQVRDAGLLPEKSAIGLDPYGVAALFDELLDRKFTEDEVVGVSQGYKLNGAVKGLERRLLDGTIQHAGQELLNWCVGNAKGEKRGNNVIITKAASGTGKIDPLVALFNAAILMDLNPVASRKGIDQFLAAPVMGGFR